jgi:hypothetical protein
MLPSENLEINIPWNFQHFVGKLYETLSVKYMKHMIFHNYMQVLRELYIENKNFTFIFIENLAKAMFVLHQIVTQAFRFCSMSINNLHLFVHLFQHIACTKWWSVLD